MKKDIENSRLRFFIPYRVSVEKGEWQSVGVGKQREVTMTTFIFGREFRVETYTETMMERVWVGGRWSNRIYVEPQKQPAFLTDDEESLTSSGNERA